MSDEFPTPPEDAAPAWQTPTGPVWVVERADKRRPWLVRQLPDAPGLLKLGATLRHTTAISHPHLQSPTLWWRERKKTWIAGPRAVGTPLAVDSPLRLTWSEATEAIAPLAVALRGAHSRGLVHGHLAPWNVFYDQTIKRLCATDFGTWAVERLETGSFVPPEMQRPKEKRHPTPATDIHNLARLLIFVALSPSEAVREKPNFETLPAYGIATLERALCGDATQRPQTIDDFLAGLSFHRHATSHASSNDEESTISGRVRGPERFEHPRQGPGVRFHLDRPGDEDSESAFVYQKYQPQVFESLQNLWDGAELRLSAPRHIEDSGGRAFLTATDETLPVVEPHWPVSVSDVLKARGCPQRVLVDLRDPGERTYHLAFGNLVHGFLEDLTANDALSFDDALKARLPDLRLDFLAAGVDDTQLRELTDQARRHFRNLRRFTTRRTETAPGHDRIGWCGEHAEATRYSARYGLEGRTDLVVNDPEEGLQIIELKSGKPWHDHPGQVKSYALLWQELAARQQLPTTGHLLYSKTGRMKEVPLDGDGEKDELLHGRNGLVTLFHSFVDPDSDYRPPFFMEQPSLCRQNACRFRRDRCRAQSELLNLGNATGDDEKADHRPDVDGDLLRRTRRYHQHLTRLVEMERWTDHSALGAIFQPHRLPQRVADGSAACELSIEPVGDDGDLALLVGEGLHIFSPGDRLLIHRGDIDADHILRARVVGFSSESLQVRLRAADLSDAIAGPGWIADAMPSRIGYRAAHRALYRLAEHGPEPILDALLRPHLSEEPEGESDTATDLQPATEDHLNTSQIEALHRALRPRPATLVQGPPGTGKTTVIAHLCAELAMSLEQSVLLSALTNTAVDTMLIKLLDASEVRGHDPPPFFRLGSAERSPLLADELRRRGYDPTFYFSDDYARHTDSLAKIARRLDNTPVIATTAHSALRHPAITYYEKQRGKPAFDVALIDEASQLTEPMALAPISTARRFVLVGDHRQLPPIVTSERALTAFLCAPDEEDSRFPLAESLRDAGLAGLDRSLFERLATFEDPAMLTTQYRMHRAIMEFPAQAFYGGRLEAHSSVADHRLELSSTPLPPPLECDAPVVFVDVDGAEVGRTNPEEADLVLETIASLVDTPNSPSIGVLSPFRAQVHLLRRLARQNDLEDRADIETVERFQGNERDVILASLVKTEHPGDFLADVRRLNVALTRARKKLIIFGCRSCVKQDATFQTWLSSPRTTVISWTTPN